MKINPYLNFDGQCEAAFAFYAECLRGQISAQMRFADTPARDSVPESHSQRIMHTCLMVGDEALMGSDSVPQCPSEPMKGCSIALNLETSAEAERVFAALAEGGTVQMALQQTFWAVRFGSLVDRFGVSWLINCEKDG